MTEDELREKIKKMHLYYHDPDELGEDAFIMLGDDEVDEIITLFRENERLSRISGRLTETRRIRQHLKDTDGYIDDGYFKSEILMLTNTQKEKE